MARSKVHLLELLGNANAVLLEEEYHDALVGHSVGANPRAIYDVEKILSIEQARTGWKKKIVGIGWNTTFSPSSTHHNE